MRDVFPEAVGLDPEVFEETAEAVAGKHFATACSALLYAARKARSPHEKLFIDLFMPDSGHHTQLWWPVGDEGDNARVLALLLAAEIVRDANGDTPAELPATEPVPAPQPATFCRK